MWDVGADRIRRADPLLMGAAIAYNSLFALVPLATAFVAMLSFFDRSDSALTTVYETIAETFPPDLAVLLTDLLQESARWIGDARGPILAISILVALWSGSRAVYAIQKALRAVEGHEEARGYLVSRLLGIGVTIAAGIGVMIAYLFALVGGRIWTAISDQFGIVGGNVARGIGIAAAVTWVWLLLWAIYRWGPPEPMRRSGLNSGIVAVILVVGSLAAFALTPTFESSTLSFLGAIGLFLVWLYFIGIVVVAVPTILMALAAAVSNQLDR
jgi:YihY family inner membrane protein